MYISTIHLIAMVYILHIHTTKHTMLIHTGIITIQHQHIQVLDLYWQFINVQVASYLWMSSHLVQCLYRSDSTLSNVVASGYILLKESVDLEN